MRPPDAKTPASQRMRDEVLIQPEVGAALRRTYESIEHDPLPSKMVLLLMQLAVVEILRTTAEQEPNLNQAAGPVSTVGPDSAASPEDGRVVRDRRSKRLRLRLTPTLMRTSAGTSAPNPTRSIARTRRRKISNARTSRLSGPPASVSTAQSTT